MRQYRFDGHLEKTTTRSTTIVCTLLRLFPIFPSFYRADSKSQNSLKARHDVRHDSCTATTWNKYRPLLSTVKCDLTWTWANPTSPKADMHLLYNCVGYCLKPRQPSHVQPPNVSCEGVGVSPKRHLTTTKCLSLTVTLQSMNLLQVASCLRACRKCRCEASPGYMACTYLGPLYW